MKILIFGGTGFVGKYLVKKMVSLGHQVAVVSRNRQKVQQIFGSSVLPVEWDAISPFPSLGELVDTQVVINLTGESIGGKRWTAEVKEEILNSRVKSTRAIVDAIKNQVLTPQLFINASAVGYYGPRQDEWITEIEPPGKDFLAQVCIAWEKEAYQIQKPGLRVVTLRNAVILDQDSIALQRLLMPYHFFVGGPIGSGEQWFTWIHLEDLTRMILFILDQPTIEGPVNTSSPEPEKMKNVAKIIGRVLGRPAWIPVPSFVLKLLLGQMSDTVLKGQRITPKKLLDAGFTFQYPTLSAALENILARKS